MAKAWRKMSFFKSNCQIAKVFVDNLLWQGAGVLSRWRGQFYMLDKAPKSLFQKGSKKAILLSLWSWARDHVIGLFEKRNKKYKAVKPSTSSGQDCSGASSSSWNWREIEFAVLSTFSPKCLNQTQSPIQNALHLQHQTLVGIILLWRRLLVVLICQKSFVAKVPNFTNLHLPSAWWGAHPDSTKGWRPRFQFVRISSFREVICISSPFKPSHCSQPCILDKLQTYVF